MPEHSSLCAINSTGHRGPCTCGGATFAEGRPSGSDVPRPAAPAVPRYRRGIRLWIARAIWRLGWRLMPDVGTVDRAAANRFRWWWFTENGIRRRPTWWFLLRFKLIAWRENCREDDSIKAWATYDAGAQDVGRALYVAETMIHLAILEGSDPRDAVSTHLNAVRDKFAIPYAKVEDEDAKAR